MKDIGVFEKSHRFLSNFYICKIIDDEGLEWSNTESLFQSYKDLSRREDFLKLSPLEARKLGRKVNLRPDWEDIKMEIMENIVRLKFSQNPSLAKKLLETQDAKLIEGNAWGDTFWGVSKGKGENNLGKILMKVRSETDKDLLDCNPNYSWEGLKLTLLQEEGVIKSNDIFWERYHNINEIEKCISSIDNFPEKLFNIQKNIEKDGISITSIFDKEFPIISGGVSQNSDIPYLLFTKGNLSLLSDLNKNIAVIGSRLVKPEVETIERSLVRMLVKNNINIVSGLADGCDFIAHDETVKSKGATIAVLPMSIKEVLSSKNGDLADDIISKNGLLVTEYYKKEQNDYKAKGRYIERDRLQAIFSKGVILICGKTTGGSRHAMNKAVNYSIPTLVVYKNSYKNDENFSLNRAFLAKNTSKVANKDTVMELCQYKDNRLSHIFE